MRWKTWTHRTAMSTSKVETGVSDDSYTEIKSGLQEDDTVAYDTSSVSDDYYSDSYSDSIW